MAIALLVTLTEAAYGEGTRGITSETITFVSERSAEKALETLEENYKGTSIIVRGTILKDVVI